MTTFTTRDATVTLRDQSDYTGWMLQLQAPAGIGEPERLSELSSSGQKAFKEDLEYYRMSMEQYKSDRHRYEKEQSSFQHIMTLIQSSVSPHLLRTCCLPDKTLREWIANLQLTVGVDDETEKDRARERYLAALRPMRSAAQWDTWLAEYDQAATHAETYNVPELSQLSTTTKDFLAAVNKTAPIWATNFQDNGRGAVGMSRKEMMKRFREHMMINHPLRSGKHKAAMAAYDGPYGSTLAGGEYDQELSGTPHSSKSAPSTKMKPGQTPLTTYRDVLVNNAELGQTPIPTYKLEAQSPRLRDLQNKTLSPLLEYNAKHVDNIIASEHAFISTQRLPQNGGNLMRQ
ncbi:hypothetical protein A1F94_003846 [Pyrenophora tritici-repentis]|nr:hypothetical protein A1F94_003846 [Pyrenophora tritici-repentis]